MNSKTKNNGFEYHRLVQEDSLDESSQNDKKSFTNVFKQLFISTRKQSKSQSTQTENEDKTYYDENLIQL